MTCLKGQTQRTKNRCSEPLFQKQTQKKMRAYLCSWLTLRGHKKKQPWENFKAKTKSNFFCREYQKMFKLDYNSSKYSV